MNDNHPDKRAVAKDPEIGHKTTVYFSLDDLLAPAIEAELVRRGWTGGTWTVAGLQSQVHESALLGMHITLERTK
jgi:hypothetical protein